MEEILHQFVRLLSSLSLYLQRLYWILTGMSMVVSNWVTTPIGCLRPVNR